MKIIKDIILKHFEYRRQVYKLAKTEFIKENSNSVLGSLWNIVRPLIMIFVYWFAIVVGFKAGDEVSEYPYFLWLLIGIVPWFYISDMLKTGTNCLRKNSYLVTKMKFPITLIPTFVNLSRLFTHLCLLGIAIIIYLLMGYKFSIYILQLPVYILLTFVFLNIWSYATAFISAFSKDIYNLVKSLITPLFWMSGIIWNIDKINLGWLNTILGINPIAYLVTGYRSCFLEGKWFFEEPIQLGIFLGIVIVLGIIGVVSHKKLRRDIPDVL